MSARSAVASVALPLLLVGVLGTLDLLIVAVIHEAWLSGGIISVLPFGLIEAISVLVAAPIVAIPAHFGMKWLRAIHAPLHISAAVASVTLALCLVWGYLGTMVPGEQSLLSGHRIIAAIEASIPAGIVLFFALGRAGDTAIHVEEPSSAAL